MSEARRQSRDLRRRMADHGLQPGPRSVSRQREVGPSDAERWAALLGESGPITAAFGRYLARRADLLSAADRAAFDRCQAADTPSAESVERALEQALGGSRDVLAEVFAEVLADVDPRAEVSDWSGSWHHARRVDGSALRLFVARPGLAREVSDGLELLRELLPFLDGRPWTLPASLLADFRAFEVEPRVDTRRKSEIFDRLGRALDLGDLLVPQLVPELTRAGVMALEAVPDARGLLTGGALRIRGPQAARQLGDVVVRLISDHGVLAHELDLGRLDDGRLVLLDGVFLEQASVFSSRLLDYLRAVASQRPEQVMGVWRQEIDESSAELEQVRSRFRQATPRRGGAVSAHRSGETAAEYAVTYWRSAAAAGVELGAPWRASLGVLEGLSRRLGELDPDGDPLADALLDHTWRHGWHELRRLATPALMAAMAERYGTALLELPPRLDRWLDRPPTGSPTAPIAGRAKSGARGGARAGARAGGQSASAPSRAWPLVVAMVVVAVSIRAFDQLAIVEAVGSGLFLLLAASLLRELTR